VPNVKKRKNAASSIKAGTICITVELDFKEAFTGWERTITNIKKKLIIIENEGTMQHGPKSVSPNCGMPQGRTPIQ
jgi:DnaJ homolog subfamily B member 4